MIARTSPEATMAALRPEPYVAVIVGAALFKIWFAAGRPTHVARHTGWSELVWPAEAVQDRDDAAEALRLAQEWAGQFRLPAVAS